MAITQMTLDEIKARPSKPDRAKIKVTTEQEIRQHMIEDREDPDAELREQNTIFAVVYPQPMPSRGDEGGSRTRRQNCLTVRTMVLNSR
jgi:hypothetical protein